MIVLIGMVLHIQKVVLIHFESTNEFGCTDIATLNLTINNSSSSSEDVTSCDSYDWNGVTYTERLEFILLNLPMSLVVIQYSYIEFNYQ